MTDKTLTAADFAVARFAEHPDGRIAVRADPDSKYQWWVRGREWYTNQEMADHGWRIVTPAPDPSDPDVIEQTAQRAYEAYRGAVDGSVPWSHLGAWTQGAWIAAVRAALTLPPARDPEAEKLDEPVMTAAREASVHLEADVAKRFADSLAAQYVRVGGGEDA